MSPPPPSLAGQDALAFERTPGAAAAPLREPAYRRREPQTSPLYQLLQQHLETLLDDARERSEHGFGYPRHVEQALRRFMACGVLAAGFCRVLCPSCHFERFVAFSCKTRNLCPSCEGRRTADTAAHWVDRLLPLCRYRQWVITFPIGVRLLLAKDERLLSAVCTIFIRRVFCYYRKAARDMGVDDGNPAAVTAVQLFGGALNCNPHLHALLADGVFRRPRDGSGVEFVGVLAPQNDDVNRVCKQVHRRVQKLIEQQLACGDLADIEDEAAAEPELAFAPLGPRGTRGPGETWEHPREVKPLTATIAGFSLHAATWVDAENRAGLERLCRYILRSSFSLERLCLRADGLVVYRLKRPLCGASCLVLEPLAFLRRLVRLIPRPGFNLVRYHGAFASRSPLRQHLLALVEPLAADAANADHRDHRCGLAPTEPAAGPQLDIAALAPHAELWPALCPLQPALSAPPDTPPHSAAVGAGSLVLRQRRLDWAQLLKRTFRVDVLSCPRCADRMRVIAAISDPMIVRRILNHLGLPADRPPIAPPRSPPQLDFDDHTFAS